MLMEDRLWNELKPECFIDPLPSYTYQSPLPSYTYQRQSVNERKNKNDLKCILQTYIQLFYLRNKWVLHIRVPVHSNISNNNEAR